MHIHIIYLCSYACSIRSLSSQLLPCEVSWKQVNLCNMIYHWFTVISDWLIDWLILRLILRITSFCFIYPVQERQLPVCPAPLLQCTEKRDDTNHSSETSLNSYHHHRYQLKVRNRLKPLHYNNKLKMNNQNVKNSIIKMLGNSLQEGAIRLS